MDARQFDALTRFIVNAPSRRRLLSGLAASGLALLAGSLGEKAVAGKRKKRKKKPLERNEFDCVPVGKPCRGRDDVCCSGICEGKKPGLGKRDRSECVAHDTAGCQAGEQSWSCGATGSGCTSSVGNPAGACQTTTGNAGYCAVVIHCQRCRKDADCQALLANPRAACISCVACGDGTSCVEPDV